MSVDTPKYRAQAAALGTIIDSICEALADPAHPEESPVDAARRIVRERDALADLVGATIVRASLAPGETAASDGHALTAAVDQLRARAEQVEGERDSARRLVCEAAAVRAFPGFPAAHPVCVGWARGCAKRNGWGYLYD